MMKLSNEQRTFLEEFLRRAAKQPSLDAEPAPHWFHSGQQEAWNSARSVIAIIAGSQSGKTVFGPWWLRREIQRRGHGDYAVVSPNLTLLFKKAHPEFMRVFQPYGRYIASPTPRFEFSPGGLLSIVGNDYRPVTIYFGYGENSDSLESMTLKGAWLDECGQRAFKATSWEALNRRCAIHRARMLLTTTPYSWNWLKTEVFDRGLNGDAHIDLVNFSSLMNPQFDPVVYERQRALMPPWRHQMMFEGKFTRPAGMIYDSWTDKNLCDRFLVPRHWTRMQGVDFGNVNTAAVFAAIDPVSGQVFIYRSYHQGGLDAEGHVQQFLGDATYFAPGTSALKSCLSVGGAASEDDWRRDYAAAKWPIQRPFLREVEAGISRVYGLIQSGRLKVFRDLTKLVDEITTYSRMINESGEPRIEIEDKHAYHRVDALRYLSTVIQDLEGPIQVRRAIKDLPVGFESWSDPDEDSVETPLRRVAQLRQRPNSKKI